MYNFKHDITEPTTEMTAKGEHVYKSSAMVKINKRPKMPFVLWKQKINSDMVSIISRVLVEERQFVISESIGRDVEF